MPRDERNPLVKKLALQNEKSKQRHVDTLLHFQEKAHRKVSTHNEFGHKRCILEIPIYEVGMPLYDCYWVRNRLVKILRKDGFFIEPTGNTSLVIDWSTDALQKQEAAARDEKKAEKSRKKKVREEKRIKKSPPKLINL
tara:strand:+ start:326 stop:742 length:417 start_codon:yes stop_codon:yes gene_type:complete